jgi:hypothetical protein
VAVSGGSLRFGAICRSTSWPPLLSMNEYKRSPFADSWLQQGHAARSMLMWGVSPGDSAMWVQTGWLQWISRVPLPRFPHVRCPARASSILVRRPTQPCSRTSHLTIPDPVPILGILIRSMLATRSRVSRIFAQSAVPKMPNASSSDFPKNVASSKNLRLSSKLPNRDQAGDHHPVTARYLCCPHTCWQSQKPWASEAILHI